MLYRCSDRKHLFFGGRHYRTFSRAGAACLTIALKRQLSDGAMPDCTMDLVVFPLTRQPICRADL